MPLIRSSIFIAIAGLALSGAGPREALEGDSAKHLIQRASNKSKSFEVTLPPVRPTAPIETGKETRLHSPCRQGQDDRQSELCAQWKAADAAYYATLVAVLGTLVAAIGTLGIYWQIKLTRKALQETRDATVAVKAGNEIAMAAQRPWVAINVTPTALERQGKSIKFEADVFLTNKGQSAARNVCIGWNLVYSSSMKFETVDAIFEGFDRLKKSGRKIVIPGDTEKFRYWNYRSVDDLPWGTSATWKEGEVGAVFVVSALYQSDITADKWLRTDQAFLVCYRREGQMRSGISRSFRRIRADSLILEPITVGALGE